MSFWDQLKPAEKLPVATHVELCKDQRVVTLTWDDGKSTKVMARRLRQACPCASCVEEWTGKQLLDPESVPADLKISSIAPVGNYALHFAFGDGHGTGIFRWKYLRELSQSVSE